MRKFIALLVALLALRPGGGIRAEEAPYTVAFASFGAVNSAIYIADSDGTHERVLVAPSATDTNPSFSPDGQWVLFTSRRAGSADIHRVRTDGTRLERLTDTPAFDDQAVMSPAGNQLAFVSTRGGQADIWLLDMRSRRTRNLTAHAGGDYRPAWSPDGRWIAFTTDRDSAGARASTPGLRFGAPQRTSIYVMRADGSNLRRVTTGDSGAGGAAWSPDGTQIAFYEAPSDDWGRMSRSFRGPAASSQIVSIEVASGRRAVHTTGPGRKLSPKWTHSGRIAYIAGPVDEQPGTAERVNYESERIAYTGGAAGPKGAFSNVNWSPRGNQIVFHRATQATWPPLSDAYSLDPNFRLLRTGIFPSFAPGGRRLVVNTGQAGVFHNSLLGVDADGANRTIIFDDPELNAVGPAWSPRGDVIAFGRGRFNSAGRSAPGRIALIAPDGTGLRYATADDGSNYGFPAWSPDGRHIVFRAIDGPAKGLRIVDEASGAMRTLTSGPWIDNFPAWSPLGDRIVFTSDRDGDWELYSIAVDGSGLKRLTQSPGNDAHPAWSPDGRWIAFASARGGFKDELPVGEGGGQGAGDIFVMRADGSDVRRLTDDAFEEGTPTFRPNSPTRPRPH